MGYNFTQDGLDWPGDILAKAGKRCCVWECLGKLKKKSRVKAMGKNSWAVGVKREEGGWEQMKF